MLTEQEEIDLYKKIHSFITAALLAVEIARIDCTVSDTPFATSNFIRRWLKLALKQKRFHRDLADLIVKFLGKSGVGQDLKKDFYTIYNEYRANRIRSISYDQSDVARLTSSLESMAKFSLTVQVPLDYNAELKGPYQHETNNELLILKTDYDASIKSNKLVDVLDVYMVGDRQPVIDTLFEKGFLAELTQFSEIDSNKYTHFRLYPKNNVEGVIALPTHLL